MGDGSTVQVDVVGAPEQGVNETMPLKVDFILSEKIAVCPLVMDSV
jgi:hypothetical protein